MTSSPTPSASTDAGLVIILNPASGSADENFRATIEKALLARGATFEVWETTAEVGGGVLAARAAQAGAQHIVACGGDGTVMSIVNGLGKWQEAGSRRQEAGSRQQEAEYSQGESLVVNSPTDAQNQSPIVLSIIPGGTANLLAGALGIPKDVEEATAIAVAGEERAIDLGRCGEHLFALGVGLGLTEKLVSQASAEQKEKLGKWAYVLAMLRELRSRPTLFSFRLDDGVEQTEYGVAVVVANAGQIGGNLHFAPDAKMDDGLLDLCILHRFYMSDVLRMLARSLMGQLSEDRAVSFYQAKKIEVRSTPPLDLQIDGEVVDMTTPLVTEVLPSVLHVRVAAEAVEEIS